MNSEDLDRSMMKLNNRPLFHETSSLISDHEISDLKNKISVEIIKLVRTHLNNAQIKGIITAEILDHLLHGYIIDLKQMEQGLKRKELHERLHELEKMQEQLVHAYHESLGKLHTDVQNVRSLSIPNEAIIQKNETRVSQSPHVVSEPRARTRRQRTIAGLLIRGRFRKIQQASSASISKYLLPAVVISALTAMGIRFGMTIFMVTGSLMIGGTLLVRFIKR